MLLRTVRLTTYKLFISGIFPFTIFGRQLAMGDQIMESETTDERALL